MGKGIKVALFIRMTAAAAFLILFGGPAWSAQDQRVATVHVFGSGRIHGQDMSAGRNEAISASLVSAVSQVLTDIAPPELVAGHFQVVNESIIARTDRFILDYKLLAESKQKKEVRVMVRATVSIQRLKNALKQAGIYLGRKRYPRVLVCIAERQMDQPAFQYWWGGQPIWQAGPATRVMTQRLETKGFSLINPTVDSSRRGYAAQLSIPEAVALGQEMRADIVVVGTGISEGIPDESGSGAATIRGSLTARAFRVKDGQQIGQIKQAATATEADPLAGSQAALENAALLAGDGLAGQMISAWFSADKGASNVEIWVQGISGNIANFVKFRGALSTMSGVDSVQRKEMKADLAVLLVDYQGNRQALADALMRQGFDTFSLEITGQEGNVIRLQMVAR
ncbi:MAG: hypothetical protein P8X96_16550 [Desulfobacteraceae bacterium]